MDKYARPYCKNCKLMWGRWNIGFVMKCTKCGRSLILKSFNPWFKFFLGLVIIVLGLSTFLFPFIPILWIGGFLWGGSLMFSGFDQWNKVKELDKKSKPF